MNSADWFTAGFMLVFVVVAFGLIELVARLLVPISEAVMELMRLPI